MPRIRSSLVLALTSLVLLAACAQQTPDQESVAEAAASSATSEPDTTPSPAGPEDQDDATMTDSDPQVSARPQVVAAIEDLAERRGVPSTEVTVVELVEVTWADGAIGCPKPGMQYSQALVPGQLLTLAVQAPRATDSTDSAAATSAPQTSAPETFAYHAGSRGTFRFCADPEPPAETGEGSGSR